MIFESLIVDISSFHPIGQHLYDHDDVHLDDSDGSTMIDDLLIEKTFHFLFTRAGYNQNKLYH